MNESDYRRLKAALLNDWTAALTEFATSEDNVKVYAVAAQFHPVYGDPVLALNTERGFDQIVARYTSESPSQLVRLGGARWNPAEFMHFDIAPNSSLTRQLIEQFQSQVENCSEEEATAQANRLAETMVGALQELSTSFHDLDRTPDFVSYVWLMDANESEMIELTRCTVPSALFDRLFPEVGATKAFMDTIRQSSEQEQAAFWASALRHLVLETSDPTAGTLRALGRTEYDVVEALVNVGSAAIPELVRIAEAHALAEEWNERDSDEFKRRGASTRSGMLASSALLALQDFDHGSEDIIARLQVLLQSLCDRDRDRRIAGINGQLTARALHALSPQRFPEAQFSDKTNHLLNFTDFGVK